MNATQALALYHVYETKNTSGIDAPTLRFLLGYHLIAWNEASQSWDITPRGEQPLLEIRLWIGFLKSLDNLERLS